LFDADAFSRVLDQPPQDARPGSQEPAVRGVWRIFIGPPLYNVQDNCTLAALRLTSAAPPSLLEDVTRARASESAVKHDCV
jgi:hypothetical protein